MTNNPTIDGVSLLPCPFCGGNPHKQRSSGDERDGYADRVSYVCSGCGCAKGAKGDASKGGYADNSKVEAQAADAWNSRAESPEVAALQSTLFEAIAHGDDAHRGWLKAAIDAHFSRSAMPEYVPSGKDQTIDALQSTIAQLEDKLNKAIDLDFQRRETIARLEARVQELESGDEPIYQVQYRGEGGGGWSDAEKESYDAKVPHPKHWKTRIVYAASPAPVAASLPNGWQDTLFEEMERRFDLREQIDDGHMVSDDTQVGVEFAIKWVEACLDATAALNGVKS